MTPTDRTGPAGPGEPVPRPPAAAPRGALESHRVAFTGRGGEYFRVWIVNVLLTLVTIGLYTPFARKRTVQYFYGHTLVAGTPLEFTASARRMFVGFLVLVLMYVIYNVAESTGQYVVAGVMLVISVVLTPFFWGSAMRFRLRSTRWRGVRLAFVARWREVYAASWPMFVMVGLWLALFTAMALMTGSGLEDSLNDLADIPEAIDANEDEDALRDMDTPFVPLFGLGVLLVGLLSLLCFVRLEFNYRRLFVRRARVGQQFGLWKPTFGAFVRIWLATAGLALLCFMVIGVLVSVLMVLGFASVTSQTLTDFLLRHIMLAAMLAVLGLVMFFVLTAPVLAYREARVFRLVWDQVGLGHIARSKCTLGVWGFVGLRMKNVLFTLLTLGFYRPFARVSEYRRKVESVTLHVRGGIDQLEGQLVREQGALGDALADAMGLDIIG
ncbi:MAG: YjgN family protein [Pseudomonadota bacterium]|nr:YjgN family protein [Pseudomonadota bacterium]